MTGSVNNCQSAKLIAIQNKEIEIKQGQTVHKAAEKSVHIFNIEPKFEYFIKTSITEVILYEYDNKNALM